MADTIVTVNAEGGADYTSLVSAIENSARDIGEGNRLIFECSGSPQTIGSTVNIASLGYGETGIIVIKGNTLNPLVPRTNEFVLYIQNSVIFNTQNSCRLDIETLTLDSNTYTSFLSLVRGVDSNQRFRGGEIRNSRIIKNGSSSLTLFRSSQTSSGDWVSNLKDSVVMGTCNIAIGSFATPNTTEVYRSTLSDVNYLTNLSSSNVAPSVVDSAVNLTGDGYTNGGVDPTFTNCATLDGVGVNPVPYSDFDSLFEDSVNGNYTLAGNSSLLDAGSSGNNIGADQTTESTLPIIVADSPIIADGDVFSFSLSNLEGTINTASIAGIDVLSLLTTNDAAQANSFTIDYWNYLSQSTLEKEKLPLLGQSSELLIGTENGVATLGITYVPKEGWDYVVVSDANKEDNGLADSLEDDLSLTVEDGDVFYYSVSGNTSVDTALNYSSDWSLETDHTDFILQKNEQSTDSYDSYAGEFFPYQASQPAILPTANAGPDRTPALVAQMVGKNGASLWQYDSADSPAEVRQNGYFTDGVALGMKVGDVVTQIDTVGATVHHMYTVKSLNSDGSVNLSDGTAIN